MKLTYRTLNDIVIVSHLQIHKECGGSSTYIVESLMLIQNMTEPPECGLTNIFVRMKSTGNISITLGIPYNIGPAAEYSVFRGGIFCELNRRTFYQN